MRPFTHPYFVSFFPSLFSLSGRMIAPLGKELGGKFGSVDTVLKHHVALPFGQQGPHSFKVAVMDVFLSRHV
jgi:hypothetical protein